MPTRIFRRTPATEEAASYGYRGFLGDIIREVGNSASRNVERALGGRLSSGELMEMGMAGLGGVVKLTKTPQVVKGLMKQFAKEGLHYDAYVNPLPDRPDLAYHQWTFYGEGPLKKATFATKTTDVGEMEGKISELMRKFSKEPSIEALIGTTKTVIQRPELEKLKMAGWKWKQAGLEQQPGYSHPSKLWRSIEPTKGRRRPVILIPPK